MTSEPRAETMTFEQLRPYWAGLFKEKAFFSYARCQACGLLHAPEFLTDPELAELYADMAPNMDVVPDAAIEATQRGYFDAAAARGTLDGDYIEIGPDIGHIAAHAAREGRFERFWLFEPNRAVHAALASAVGGRPHSIQTDMTDLSEVPDGQAGLAVMVHVLDHLLDPLGMIAQLHAKLRPGGTLMIVTHNEASWLRHVMGRRWPPFCLQHPQLFNPKSMTALLERAGFGNVAVERSRNYFPLSFMVRQAAWTAGIKLQSLPLPGWSVGLKLGNIITLATKP